MRRLRALMLFLAALALDVWGCWQLAGAAGATNDLFPRWLGTRMWLSAGADLYGAAVNEAVRSAMGSVPLGGEGPFAFGFVYPAYVALLLAPLALLPFQLAATLWLLVIQACVVAGTVAIWRAHEAERGLPGISPGLTVATALLFPASVLNLVFLQFSAPVFMALAIGWLLLVHRRSTVGGAVLVLSVIKPQVALVPVALLLARAIASGQRAALVSFASVAGALGVLSVALMPGWPASFVSSLADYSAAAGPMPASGVVASALGGGGTTFGVLLAAVASVLIAAAWLCSDRALGPTVQAGVLGGTWLVPPLYEWNSVLLLAVVVPALRDAARLGSVRYRTLAGALLVLMAVTAYAYTRWPGEARVIWPVAALALYCGPGAARVLGKYSASVGSASLPPAATRT
jgi:hypothetical protein